MNDFEGLLPSDYGFKPSNKSEPISGSRSARPASNSFSAAAGDADSIFAGRSNDFAEARHGAKSPAFDLDSVFDKRPNSEPVYDKPVYDDDGGVGAGDIFDGVPGIRSSSSSKVKYDDVFSSSSSSPPRGGGGGVGGGNVSAFDDLLGGFGKAEPPRWKSAGGAKRPEKSEKSVAADFDDLFQGFGASSPPTERSAQDSNASKTTSKVMEDPFVSTGQFSDPLEEITKFSNSRSMKSDSVGTGRSFDDVDPFDGLINTTSSFTSERENRGKETSGTKTFAARETREKPSVRSPETQTERNAPVENDWDSRQTFFDMPTSSTDTYKSFEQTMTPPSYASASFKDSNTQVDRSPRSEENMESADDIWLSVSEVPLYTPPTSAPPPSRPPPPRPVAKAGISKTSSANARRKNNEFSSFPNPSQSFQVPNSSTAAGRSSVVSPIDELEDFVRGRRQDNVDEHVNGLSGEDMEMNSVAAAMKEAMDRAQAKFRQAKEVRERENTKASRSKEGQSERDEKLMLDERAREKQERLERQRLQKEREEEEMEQQRLEREREKASEIEREREEIEREQRRLEKEKERAREIEKEREKARQAVERATREARERAALDARQRAERAKAERAAVDKATAEARERAERAAVQRAQAEARERAAADAKERAEKAAAEARERANAEAKEREARERAATFRAEAEARVRAAERAAVGRAAAEARERAAAEARERAAAATRANQQKNENDIESFFNSRASSAPRPRTNSSDPFFDTQSQNKSEAPRAPSGNSSNIKKASSATNIVDDLSSIFNAAPTSGDFQDVEGETEERRRARLERHQRTQERAAKALAEKNQRDLQNQREQAERHRFAETLDAEIKRWAAGKEGNLRALLSTLQYVLWQECGWQPVSLTDMITAASVKKVYRKSTLCIHPDKVQQKGANLQQKYVAEKVFDLLKEAWNKFNSEELF